MLTAVAAPLCGRTPAAAAAKASPAGAAAASLLVVQAACRGGLQDRLAPGGPRLPPPAEAGHMWGQPIVCTLCTPWLQVITVNIYRNASESFQTFDYIAQNGNFSWWEREAGEGPGVGRRAQGARAAAEPRVGLLACLGAEPLAWVGWLLPGGALGRGTLRCGSVIASHRGACRASNAHGYRCQWCVPGSSHCNQIRRGAQHRAILGSWVCAWGHASPHPRLCVGKPACARTLTWRVR